MIEDVFMLRPSNGSIWEVQVRDYVENISLGLPSAIGNSNVRCTRSWTKAKAESKEGSNVEVVEFVVCKQHNLRTYVEFVVCKQHNLRTYI